MAAQAPPSPKPPKMPPGGSEVPTSALDAVLHDIDQIGNHPPAASPRQVRSLAAPFPRREGTTFDGDILQEVLRMLQQLDARVTSMPQQFEKMLKNQTEELQQRSPTSGQPTPRSADESKLFVRFPQEGSASASGWAHGSMSLDDEDKYDTEVMEEVKTEVANLRQGNDLHNFISQQKKSLEEASWRIRCNVKEPDNCFARFILGAAFNSFVMMAIVINILAMAWEAEVSMDNALNGRDADQDLTWVDRLSTYFNIFFAAELLLRILALRLAFFFGSEWRWNLLDMILVTLSIFSEIFQHNFKANQMRVLRIVRVVKALRVMKIMRYSRSLRTMISAISASLTTLTWLFVLLILIFLTFSIFFVQIGASFIADRPEIMAGDPFDPYSDAAVVSHGIRLYMSSVPYTMWSLLFVVSGAMDWYAIGEPLGRMSPVAAVVYTFVIVFVNFGVLNVVIGIFVANAAENLDPDLLTVVDIENRIQFIQEMTNLFQLQADESGTINKQSFQERIANPEVQSFLRRHKLDSTYWADLFRICDLDGNGEITQEEFVYGALRVAGEPRAVDLSVLLHIGHVMESHNKHVGRHLHRIAKMTRALSSVA